MPYTPRRAPSELPFSGTDIILRYAYEHPAVPFDFEDTLEKWHVDIARYHGEDTCPNCPDDGWCEDAETGTPLGQMSFVRIRNYTSDPAWEAADAYTGDIEKVVSVCTDPAYAMTPGLHWSEDINEVIDMPTGDLLVMDRVQLDAQWRGFGIGALAAAEAIRRLSPGCSAVACEPAPTDGDFKDDEPGLKAAQAKLAELWESVGFTAYRDGIYLLDTAMQHPADCRARWQQHFGR